MPLSKHVLFVHAMYPHKLPAYQAARRLGYRVTVVGPDLPDWAAPFVDAYIAASTDAAVLPDTVRLLAQHHARDPFDGVVTYWDHGVVACAAIGTALGLPATSPAAAERVRNKAVSRDALGAAGVSQPRYARVDDSTSLGEAALLVGFPAVYKPCGGAGSAGVQYVATAADLPAAQSVADTKLTFENDQFFSYYPEQFILEQFVSGPEVSVEGVVAQGQVHCVGVTAKSLAPGTFIESRHVFPAALDQAATALVTQLAAEAVRATGIDNCGFHVEVMLSPQGPVIVEVNGRLGGDFITSHLVPLASGIDLMAASLKVAVGEDPDLHPTVPGAACVRFLVAERDGVVVSASGMNAAKALPGIVELGQNKVPGDRVQLPPDSYFDARLAYAISSAAEGDTAARLADQAIEAMSYDIA